MQASVSRLLRFTYFPWEHDSPCPSLCPSEVRRLKFITVSIGYLCLLVGRAGYLQGASCVAPARELTKMSSDTGKRPMSRDRRVRSAKARLTPPGPETFSSEKVRKEAKERAKSAKANRDKHTGSTKVFPKPAARTSKERFTTMYSRDFEGSFAPPADLRPTSPTRRNNPHPGKVQK